MNGKLHIDIEKGIIDVEGNEELVKTIYADFKERLLLKGGRRSTEDVEKIERDVLVKRSTKTKSREKANGGEDRKPKSADYVPALVTELDLGALPGFYTKFETKNNPEKILVFLECSFKSRGRAADMGRTKFTLAISGSRAPTKGISSGFSRCVRSQVWLHFLRWTRGYRAYPIGRDALRPRSEAQWGLTREPVAAAVLRRGKRCRRYQAGGFN